MKKGTEILASMLDHIRGDRQAFSYAVIDYRTKIPALELHHIADNVYAHIKTAFDPAEIDGVRMGIHVSRQGYLNQEQSRSRSWTPPLLTANTHYFSTSESSTWMRWELLNGVKIGEDYEQTQTVAGKLSHRLATLDNPPFTHEEAIVAEIRFPSDIHSPSFSSEGLRAIYAVPRSAIEKAVHKSEDSFLAILEPRLEICVRTTLAELKLPYHSFDRVEPARLSSLEHRYDRGFLVSNPEQVGSDLPSQLNADIDATQRLSAAILEQIPHLDRLTAVLKHRAERLEAARQKPDSR